MSLLGGRIWLALALTLAGCGAKDEKYEASASFSANSAQQEAADAQHGIFAFDLSRYPRGIRSKLLAEAAEAIACRDPAHDGPQTIAACDRLQAIHEELEEKGWCRGPTAVPVDKRAWMRCGPDASPQN